MRAACTDRELVVVLAKNRKLVTPLRWYPRLPAPTPAQRARYELSPLGMHWHWPEIDEARASKACSRD